MAVPRGLIADQPVDIFKLPAMRAEYFPYSGPYPWLDQPNALEQIQEKLTRGEITAEEADACRYWHNNGYLILDRLIENDVLDDVWQAHERAIASGSSA